VARDSLGRTRTVTRTVRVAPVPLEITGLKATDVKAGAKTTTVTVKTNVAGTLRIRGKNYAVTSRSRKIKVSLPASPKTGIISLPLQVKPKDGGRTVKGTLVVLRG
jgi:hypothetical protein